TFPGRDQVGPGILFPDDELRIPVSVGFLTIGSEKVSPARGEVARHMFDNGSDTIGELARFAEEITVCLHLGKRFVRPFFLLAEAEGNLFEISSGYTHITLPCSETACSGARRDASRSWASTSCNLPRATGPHLAKQVNSSVQTGPGPFF